MLQLFYLINGLLVTFSEQLYKNVKIFITHVPAA